MKQPSNNFTNLGKEFLQKISLGEIWNNLTSTGKSFFVIFTFVIITLPITIPIGKLIHYIVVYGEEIERFEPYTTEQHHKKFVPYDD